MLYQGYNQIIHCLICSVPDRWGLTKGRLSAFGGGGDNFKRRTKRDYFKGQYHLSVVVLWLAKKDICIEENVKMVV